MDPLSWSGSVIGTIGLIITTISLLNIIQNKPNDVRNLILELSSISGYLQSLRSLGEMRQEEAEWPKLWRVLLSSSGPISELHAELAPFARSLSFTRDLGQPYNSFKWLLKRSQLQNLLVKVERAKTEIAHALTMDQM